MYTQCACAVGEPTRTAAVCGPRSVPDTVRVRFSEAGEAPRPAGRARVSRTRATPRSRRTLSADPAALSRGGRTGTCRFTAREPVTVCRHNLGGRPGALERRSSRQSRAAGAGARARWSPRPSPPPPRRGTTVGRARARRRAGGASVWPSIRYTTLRQAWPGTRGSPRPQCAFDWSMFV